MSEGEASARAGSPTDLSRRMDRMEQRQDNFDGKLDSLAVQVTAVSHNQETAEKMNEMRFGILTNSVNKLETTVTSFINRIDGLLNGTEETSQSREGRKLVEDYQSWRKTVDEQIASIFRRLYYLFGGLALIGFVLGLTVPTILGWFHP